MRQTLLQSLIAAPILALILVANPAGLAEAQRPPALQSGGDLGGRVADIWKEHRSYEPSSWRITELLFVMGTLSIVATIVGVLWVFLKGSTWAFANATSTSDMEKLALNDPWIRAQLELRKAQGNAGQTDAAPPQGQ